MGNRILVIVCALAVSARVAAAGEGCPADAAERVAKIRAHLDREAARAHRWDLIWGIGFGAAAVGQGAMGATRWQFGREVDDNIQAGLYVGAGKAVIAALPHAILPLKIERLGDATSDACADLAAASQALAKTAKEERTVFWLNVVGTVALNGGGLLLTGYGFDAWREGVIGAAMGVPIGLLETFTQPRATLRAHRRGDFDAPTGAVTWRLDAVHGRAFTGLVVSGAF